MSLHFNMNRLINMLLSNNIVTRNYDDFILLYILNQEKYLLFEDSAVEFYNSLIKTQSLRLGAEEISQMYDVDLPIAISDMGSFASSLFDSVVTQPSANSGIENTISLEEQLLFSKFTEMLVPFTAIFEITNECNENCIHCYRPEFQQTTVWNVELFRKVLTSLKSLGCMHITLTGGEPLLHPEFEEILGIASNLDFVVSILTNGSHLLDFPLELWKENKIKRLYISLYSLDAKVHDSITRSRGSFNTTYQAILSLVKQGIPIAINTPIMIQNKNSIYSIKHFANDLGIPVEFSFKIIPSYNTSKVHTELLTCFTEDSLRNMVFDKEVRLYNDAFDRIRETPLPQDKKMCQAGFRSLTFDFEGNVLPCTALRYKLGNIFDAELIDIWNSKKINEWRNSLAILPPKCISCKMRKYCEPCYAATFIQTGEFGVIDEQTCEFGHVMYNLANSLVKIS